MRVIHINEDRFNAILQQGWKLSVRPEEDAVRPLPLDSDCWVYHLLDGEHGYCGECKSEYSSVQASTVVELQDVKMTMR